MRASQEKVHQLSLSLDAEVNRLSGQNKDLKEGYQLMRDQLRSEQLSSENITTSNRRLQEQLDILEFDVERGRVARDLEGTMSCPAMSCPVLCCTVLYCTVLCCPVLYCTVLCCPVLCCTVLYCEVSFIAFNQTCGFIFEDSCCNVVCYDLINIVLSLIACHFPEGIIHDAIMTLQNLFTSLCATAL